MLPEHNYPTQWEVGGFEWSMLERSSVAAALIVSSSGRLLAANTRLSNLLRMGALGDLAGRSIKELLLEPGDWESSSAALRTGHSAEMTLRMRRSDGESVVLRGDVHSMLDGAGEKCLLGLFVDITEQLQLRRAMDRSARLEALGSLTSGVAHDFNNLLTVLVGNLSLVAEELRTRPKEFAKLKAARDAAKRGADLIRQLLAFARNREIEADVIKPARVVDNLVPLLGRALGSKVKLATELEAPASTIRGNVAQLESVIVNLAVNARDALESGGAVVVRVSDVNVNPVDAEKYHVPAGSYVRISVADDGVGVAPEALAKVFEPFFSTKGDRGTGLGLSMVRSYATQFGGAAYMESTLKKGTTVSVLFPRCSDSADETAAKTMPLSTLPTGKEKVVLLGTDEALRSTVGQILEVLGYKVAFSADPKEAVEALRARRVELMIVDGVFAKAISQAIADKSFTGANRIVQLTSGTEGATPGNGARVLSKPFALADLAQTVRAALNTPLSRLA